jgi:DNA (cytosine-5)-methyltransferase 1
MKILSLFSGAGGLDIGFHQAGFEIVACVEIEKIFCETLAKNRSLAKYISAETVIFNQDIANFNTEQLSGHKIDFVIGGPPCQTYSASGRRIGGAPGIDDARGRLFEEYCRILENLQPVGFLFENVRGLLGVNNGEAWKEIVSAFSSLGYTLSYRVLDAAGFGVPQHRERIILVGLKEEKIFLFPRPLCGIDSKSTKPYLTVGEALADLQDEKEPYHVYDGKYGYLLAGIPEGMNYSFYTAEMGHPSPVFAWRSKFSSFLYKLDTKLPAKTVQAQLGKFAGPFHWKNRRLTVAELKRLQSFPDDYEFSGSYNQVLEQLGNSVPPLLAKYLAQSLIKQIFDTSAYPELELMSLEFKQNHDARKSQIAKKTRQVTQKLITKQETKQLALWEENAEAIAELIIPENFILSYRSPVNKVKIDYETGLKKLGFGENQVLINDQSHFFSVELAKDTDNHERLRLVINHLNSWGENSSFWKLLVKLDKPLQSGNRAFEVILNTNDEKHIYVVWDALEEVIKSLSNYISLVGLYGHFAEPKIKFKVELKYLGFEGKPFAQLVEFFSDFENCGRNIPIDYITQKIEMEKEKLEETVRHLRLHRYDIRSHLTNQRIPRGYYFCAYPFPELNAKYQINKKV